jgi:CubicO group peptidase (beta-lactamase class C family)
VAVGAGGSGLYSTTADYLNFCQMLLQRGEWNGRRLLESEIVDLMTSDQVPINITYDPMTSVGFEAEAPMRDVGQSFGLGFAIRTRDGLNSRPGSVGDDYWAGALGTYFWVDPAKDLIAIFMSQVPGLRLHYRNLMRQLVYPALL